MNCWRSGGEAHLDIDAYERAGITVTWKDYGIDPEYCQLHGPFVPHASIVDVLMRCGDRASHYLWGYREGAGAGVSPV